MQRLLLLCAAATMALVTSHAEAGYVYSMQALSKNNANNVITGQNQLRLTITDMGSGYVQFRFDHYGGANPMSITDVYFDDHVKNLFRRSVSISGTVGTSFSVDSSPEAIEGGSKLTPGFQTTESLSSSSLANGVNPGETLYVYLRRNSGVSMWNVISALNNQQFRVGINVQGFAYAGNETFVNPIPGQVPPPMVPEPSGLALAGLGILGLALRSRRRSVNGDVEC